MAGENIDRLAKELLAKRGQSHKDMKAYKQACLDVFHADQAAANRYTFKDSVSDIATTERRVNYEMSASDQAMEIAKVDHEGNKKRAGDLLSRHVPQLAGSVGRGSQVNPESYRAALNELLTAFPDLAACYNTGAIAPDNWSLLATLQPGLATKIKQEHGAEPYNLRSGRYANTTSVRKYSGDHVRFDAGGNQFRVY